MPHAEGVPAAGVDNNYTINGLRRNEQGNWIEQAHRRAGQHLYVIGYVQHAFTIALQVRIRGGSLIRPQRELIPRGANLRPHGRNMRRTIGIERGNESFENHESYLRAAFKT